MTNVPTELTSRTTGNPVLDRIDTWMPAADAAEQIDAIIRRTDAQEVLQSLEAPVFYRMMKRAGWDQSYDLVQYATPDQIQSFVDFDCWQRDRIQVPDLQKWFGALVSESSDEHFKQVCRDLDPEIPAILFKSNLEVAQTDEENKPPEHWEGDIQVTPDGTYAVKYPEDEDTATLMRLIIDRLYHVDRVLAWTLLEAVRWELMSNMEEEAYKWRNSRLEEHGFVTREEAVEVYQFTSPTKYRERLEGDSAEQADKSEKAERVDPPDRLDLPVVFREEFDEEFYVFRVLKAQKNEKELRRILFQLRALINRTMVGDGIEPGELETGREVIRRTLGYLSLGLEFLSRGDMDRAGTYLRDLPIKEIFQVGYSLTAKLQKKLRDLRDRPTLTLVESDDYSLLGEDDRALAQSLDRTRPTYAEDSRTYDIFKEQDQLDHAAFHLGMIAFKQMWLFAVQGRDVTALAELVYGDQTLNSPDEVTFDVIFATRLVNYLTDGEAPLAPVDGDTLAGLPELLRESPWEDAAGGRMAYFDELVDPIAEATPVATRKLARHWIADTLDRLDEELGAVRTIEEPRVFTSVLLLAADG